MLLALVPNRVRNAEQGFRPSARGSRADLARAHSDRDGRGKRVRREVLCGWVLIRGMIIPPGFSVPNGPSWLRLMLPVAKARRKFAGCGDTGNCTPTGPLSSGHPARCSSGWFHQWLMAVIWTRPRTRCPFNGEIEQMGRLAEDLQTGFLLLASHAPDLGGCLFEFAEEHPYSDRVREGILKFRGTLAKARQRNLPSSRPNRRCRKRGRRRRPPGRPRYGEPSAMPTQLRSRVPRKDPFWNFSFTLRNTGFR